MALTTLPLWQVALSSDGLGRKKIPTDNTLFIKEQEYTPCAKQGAISEFEEVYLPTLMIIYGNL